MAMEWNKIGSLDRLRGSIWVYRKEPWSECPNCGEYDCTTYRWNDVNSGIVSASKGTTRAIGKFCHNCRYKDPIRGEEKFNKRVSGGIKLSKSYGELDNDRYKIK